MAWNIPQELMNNNPLPIEEVEKRFAEHGLKLLDKNYHNNETRLCCEDKDGYRVMANLGSLDRTKQYMRFSPSCNLDNFMYNLDLHQKLNDIPSKVISWEYNKKYKQVKLRCQCECGNIFKVSLTKWNTLEKTRCNDCTRKLSNIALTVKKWLDNHGILYEMEYKFDNCKNKRPLPFDFYLTDYNICIEVDGEQHFYNNSLKYFKGSPFTSEDMLKRRYLDNIKTKYCIDNNITLIRLKYDIIRNGEYEKILNKEIYTN